MTDPSDDYLAQLDRALERIEATNIDTELAAKHAPHLSAPPCTPAPVPASDSRKIDLAVSLLQSNVDVGGMAANEAALQAAGQEESGLGLALVQEARSVGESFSSLSLSKIPVDQAPELALSQSIAGSRSEVSVGVPSPAPPPSPPVALRLESQEISLSRGSMSGAIASSVANAVPEPPVRPPAAQYSMSPGLSAGASTSAIAERRGLFSGNFVVNLLCSLSAATWLALWPAYELTQQWLSERSHVELAQLKASVESPRTGGKTPQALSASILDQAQKGQARFIWSWALLALVGSALLVLPYRKTS